VDEGTRALSRPLPLRERVRERPRRIRYDAGPGSDRAGGSKQRPYRVPGWPGESSGTAGGDGSDFHDV